MILEWERVGEVGALWVGGIEELVVCPDGMVNREVLHDEWDRQDVPLSGNESGEFVLGLQLSGVDGTWILLLLSHVVAAIALGELLNTVDGGDDGAKDPLFR